MRKKGFTLIEILIVTAVVTVLAAVVFPVFSKVRDEARQSACASNLKKLGIAHLAYAQDYGGTLGGTIVFTSKAPYIVDNCKDKVTFWTLYLKPYVQNSAIYRCPAGVVGTACIVPSIDNPANNTNVRSYNINISIAGYGGRIVASIRDQANKILMVDSDYHYMFGDDDKDGGRWWNYREPYVANRHNNGANVLCVDGHVKWMAKDTITAAMLNP